MQGETLKEQDFSEWNGTPFFEGYPLEGRVVYIVKSLEEGGFTAFGTLEGQQGVIFVVRGALEEFDRFVAQIESEAARVRYGLPPLDTNTGGDKATGTGRPGIREKPPVKK